MSLKKKIFGMVVILAIITVGVYQYIQNVTPVNAKEEDKIKKVTKSFKVASIEFNPILNERDKNVEALAKLTEEAFKKGAKLVVAPEMSTTGYYYANRKAIEPFVDTIPGKTTSVFAKLTKKYDAYIVFGMPEVDKKTDLYYNSAAMVGPNGYVGKYRKTQMWETETHWGAWGDLGVPVFDTELGKIAINICMDSAYFETARLAGIQGADILAFPTNSSAQAISALPARAQQNGMYIVSANRSNTEHGFHMIGGSAVWSPEGHKLAEAPVVMTEKEDVNEPTITYATINPKQYNNKNKDALKDRRPELYKELLQYVEPWDYTKNTTSHKIVSAALQYEPVMGDKAKNKEKIASLLEDAKKQDANLNLVVLPELPLTGPIDNKKDAQRFAEGTDGETVQFFEDLAKKYQVSIVAGLVEEANNHLYNSAFLISPDGSISGKYEKTHLSKEDKKWASEGSSLPVFETKELGKIGILIGEDAQFPEASGVLAVERADTIAIPSAWNGQYGGEMEISKKMSVNPYPDGSMVTWDAVAIGAQAYTVVANYVGGDQHYLGGSSLYTIDPLYGLDQPVVAPSNKEEALVVKYETLQNDNWFNQELLLLSRRTPYFVPLIQE